MPCGSAPALAGAVLLAVAGCGTSARGTSGASSDAGLREVVVTGASRRGTQPPDGAERHYGGVKWLFVRD